jgi:phosphate/sulfate permease
MKSFLNTAAAAAALFAASTGHAFAALFDLPEPSSIALVGVGIGAAVFFLNKSKKK